MAAAWKGGESLAQSLEKHGSVSLDSIQEQLQRLLAHPHFQNSRRYPKFLKYIVEKHLHGSSEELKERVIGVEVFGRPLSYEPATDPVVRLVAGEIRKRLAQYYIQPEHEHELRIEIPSGSYVPIFHWPQHAAVEAAVAELPETAPDYFADLEPEVSPVSRLRIGPIRRFGSLHERRRKIRPVIALAAGVALLIALPLGMFWWIHLRPERMLHAFWKPLLSHGSSTMICIGDWTNLTPVEQTATNSIQQSAVYVGPYDLGALARIVGVIGKGGRQFSVELANDVTLTDLRSEPGILIGSSNNRWTPTVLAGSRFQFRVAKDSNRNLLVDTQSARPVTWATTHSAGQHGMSIVQDVGLIARIVSPTTGQLELVVAGISQGGTTAASEFITNPEDFKQIAAVAPPGWESCNNIEMIVATDVINGRSGPPHLVRFFAQ